MSEMGDQKMQKFDATKINRRSFLGGAALLGGFSPLALQMAATTANAQANSYRALVCLYLDGGLDHYHTMIPVIRPIMRQSWASAPVSPCRRAAPLHL